MKFDPPNTPEQDEIIDFAMHRDESLLINALAGTAKTTTVERAASVLTHIPILYLVFNKRNQEEAVRRMPGHVKCLTANALGHGVWGKYIGRRPAVNTNKSAEILMDIIDGLGRAEAGKAYTSFATILAAVRQAKISGYIPPGKFVDIPRLIEDDPFVEVEPTGLESSLLDAVLTESIKESFNGRIDFDDQVYMPVLFGGAWPEFPLVVVDEAQDWSPINHAMLNKLVSQRLMAVGDPWQSIYAFRGAVRNGMAALKDTFNMESLTLSVSFRCPRTVVRRAWWRVPHFKWPDLTVEGEPWPEGEVNEIDGPWTPTPGSAIICRNNAPLLTAGLRLIKSGVGVRVMGRDIGPSLVRVLKKLGPESMPQAQVYDAINNYELAAKAKTRVPASLEDKCNCLRVFAGTQSTLRGAVAFAEHIFKSDGEIQLLTGHKSKGSEWYTVYHLDPWRIPNKWATEDEDREQEMNIKYVIETRAKQTLNIVNLKELN